MKLQKKKTEQFFFSNLAHFHSKAVTRPTLKLILPSIVQKRTIICQFEFMFILVDFVQYLDKTQYITKKIVALNAF